MVLVDDGIDTLEDCQAMFGPVLQAQGIGCKLKGGEARKCLDAMSTASCPGQGVLLDDALPAQCGDVWKKCPAVPGEDNEDTANAG